MSFINELKEIFNDLKKLKTDIKNENSDRINKVNLRVRAEGLANLWFSNFNVILDNLEYISKNIREYYQENFIRLLKISSPANRKSSYMDTLNAIISTFNNDLIIPITTNTKNIVIKKYDNIFADFISIPEYDYIKEAIGCAENGFFRASTVLGWSAVIYRFHNIVEKNLGFDNFNSMSIKLFNINNGRFKRFNKKCTITSRSELLEVFDTDLLWILEGFQLIDLNEHTRLTGCFNLRCQAAHPCNAPITEHNLLSFFSDIKEIVFKNEKFN